MRETSFIVFIDSSSGCAKATFDFGSAAFSRSYDIKVKNAEPDPVKNGI